jgi:NhaA family Na+:H+ antiporter
MLGLATKPDTYRWDQVLGAGCLAGIGFTMSLFIAGQSFPVPADFAAAKVAIFLASIASAALGFGVLWWADRKTAFESPESYSGSSTGIMSTSR